MCIGRFKALHSALKPSPVRKHAPCAHEQEPLTRKHNMILPLTDFRDCVICCGTRWQGMACMAAWMYAYTYVRTRVCSVVRCTSTV